MATAEQIAVLRARLNAGTGEGSLSDTELALLWDDAASQVDVYVGDAVVPAATLTRAILSAADRMHILDVSPDGATQYDAEGSPIRVSRDPLAGAYPLLARFVGGGFA